MNRDVPPSRRHRSRLLGSSSRLLPYRQPFLYLAAAVVSGILADAWLMPPRLIPASVAAMAVLASALFIRARRNWSATLSLLLGFAAAGMMLSFAERMAPVDSSLKVLFQSGAINPSDPVELTGRLAAPPEPAPGAFYLNVEAEHLAMNGSQKNATGRARLKLILVDEEAVARFVRLRLDYGSRVRVLVRLHRATTYRNPGSLDFNDHLGRNGYELTGIIKSALLIEPLGRSTVNPVLATLYGIRIRALDAVSARFDPVVAGTLKAMLFDNRHFLSGEAVERLKEGATFHVISISGTHVSIIAWALLGARRRHRGRRLARIALSLVALWSYAVMVGLNPPVTRATLMISAGLIGPLLYRRSASINTVALAASAMLAFDPALVADPGFQLSFLAVAGIAALALPAAESLRAVGEWRPSARAPYPPSSSRAVKWLAELLFWDERGFREDMRRSPMRYRLAKTRAAAFLNKARAQPVLRWTALLIITSLSIQLATLPLMVFYFNRVAPAGVLLNVLAGVLTGVLMLSGLAAIAAAEISLWAGSQLQSIASAAHYLLVNSIAPFEDIPLSTFRVPHYEGLWAVVYALYFAPLAILALLVDAWQPVQTRLPIDRIQQRISVRESNPSRLLAAAGSLLLCLLLAIRVAPQSNNGKLVVHFLDVGQGDCALVLFPSGKSMLIDAGGEVSFTEPDGDEEMARERRPGVGEFVVSRFLWSLGRTRIDYLLATHAHADHTGGFKEVIKNLDVGQAIVARLPDGAGEFSRALEYLSRRGVPVAVAGAGERYELDGIVIELLWPRRPSIASQESGNDDSIVIRLSYGSIVLLLTGDIERPAEERLVQSGAKLRADLLKVPHHGSRTSSSEAFIEAVRPSFAVISAGERSRFGHPHAEVVNRYLARGVKLLQTGRDGMVSVESDGRSINVTSFASSRE